MAGEAEARLIECGLVDRVGDHGRGGPGPGQGYGPHNAGDDRSPVLWVRPARLGRHPLAERQDRQGLAEHAHRLGRIRHRADRRIACQRLQADRVVDRQEHRARRRQPPPRRQQDLAADAGGLAHGHRQWR